MRTFVLVCLGFVVACDSGVVDPRADDGDVDQVGDTDQTPTDDDPAPVPCTTASPQPGTVITASGAVTGVKSGTTWSWKGIPYAASPTGERRWQAPAPYGCFEGGALSAVAHGPVCSQLEDGAVIGSEDCLHLNIWAPEGATDLPVLFYVHGGGNVQGTASDPLYDGHELATRTNRVVVTVEYRVGVLGYFTHRGLDDESPAGVSGNYGILDQVAALEWVRDNIAGFGGSASNVLLFGESAGGQNTLVHLVSPLSAGLFHSAIVESGGLYRDTIADAQAEHQAVVADVGCNGTADVIACMRGVPSNVLTSLPTAVTPLDANGRHFGPVIDGYVMEENPFLAMQSGAHNHVPFVIGTNADETSGMVPTVVTESTYEAFLRTSYGNTAAEALLEAYPVSDYANARKALIAVTTDILWTCPARRIARSVSASQDEPVFRYHFTWSVPGAGGAVYGATHGLELPFVFRTFGAFGDFTPAPADIALSEAMQGYWSRLPASGDVNGGTAVTWPVYNPSTDPYLELDTTIVAKAGLANAHCDLIESLAP